jgi:hypothetical protein
MSSHSRLRHKKQQHRLRHSSSEYIAAKSLANCNYRLHRWIREKHFTEARNRHEAETLALVIDRMIHKDGLDPSCKTVEIAFRRCMSVWTADRAGNDWSAAAAIEWDRNTETLLPQKTISRVLRDTANWKALRNPAAAATGKRNARAAQSTMAPTLPTNGSSQRGKRGGRTKGSRGASSSSSAARSSSHGHAAPASSSASTAAGSAGSGKKA